MAAVRLFRNLTILLILVAACSKKASKPAAGSGSAQGSAPPPITATIAGEWNVVATNGQCSANDLAPCKPDVECEPPAPLAIECPAGAEAGNVRVVELSDHTCAIAPADCKANTCLGARTPCPLAKGESLPPLAWAVTAMADGTCNASWTAPGAGTQVVTITCPLPGVTSHVIRRADAKAPCMAEAEGKPATAVPCPAPPKQLTVVSLRAAAANDPTIAGQRVRIRGFNVAKLTGSVASHKETTYFIGASDIQGDKEIAVKCASVLPFPDIADGEDLVIEGAVKGKLPDELVLVQCSAAKP